jgi:hypothetical protein
MTLMFRTLTGIYNKIVVQNFCCRNPVRAFTPWLPGWRGRRYKKASSTTTRFTLGMDWTTCTTMTSRATVF